MKPSEEGVGYVEHMRFTAQAQSCLFFLEAGSEKVMNLNSQPVSAP